MVDVTIYTKKGCPFCKRAKEVFTAQKIIYQEKDITDKDVRSRIITRDGNTPAPQVEIKGMIIFDYTTEEKLAEEVKKILNSA